MRQAFMSITTGLTTKGHDACGNVLSTWASWRM